MQQYIGHLTRVELDVDNGDEVSLERADKV